MGPLEGQLNWYFLVAVLDAALLSWLVIAWYRRRMLALMSAAPSASGAGRPGHERAPLPEASEAVAAIASSFHLDLAGRDSRLDVAGRDFSPDVVGRDFSPASAPSITHRDRDVRRRLFAAYATGAALYSAVITPARFASEAATFPLAGWLAQWWIAMWPIVPTLALLLALDRRASVRLAVKYLGIGCAVVLLVTLAGQALRGSFNSAPVTNVFWMLVSLGWSAAAPLVLILLTSLRPIRGVTPMIMAATLLFAVALLLFWRVVVRALNLEGVQSAVIATGTSWFPLLGPYAIFMLVGLPAGWIAWLVLRRLASRFEQKRFSDMQLIVDCWWLIVAALAVPSLPGSTAWAVAVATTAFGAYKAGVRVVLAAWPLEVNTNAPRLLLLRVFGYQARTERLFDRIAAVWRFRGPVHLIAAPDLATRTVDPGDTLALIGGRLADQYVGSASEIPQRMTALDRRPDPDGRYRVNEVYCRDDTWRESLEALLDSSDGVLMDLRSFSRQNAGCIFEIEQIVRRVPGAHVVLIVDRTTDVPFLQAVAEAAWMAAGADGRTRGNASVAAVTIEGHSRDELAHLWARLDRIGDSDVNIRPDVSIAAASSA